MDFSGNPNLVTPPRETVLAGGSAIRSWLKSYFYGEHYSRIRLYALGHGGMAFHSFAPPSYERRSVHY